MVDKVATVFGASGFVGRHVVRELAAQGWRVRAAVRRPAEAQFLRPLGAVGQIEIVQANVRFKPSVANALEGSDAVVNLVAILEEVGTQKFDTIHVMGAENVASAAAEAGVSTFVHVSAIGASADGPSEYAKTKAQGEAAVREHISAATILRPSIIFGPQDAFFNRFASMAQIAPALPLIGGGQTKFQPVYVDDVAECITKAVDAPAEYAGRTFELGGPEVKSFKELMQLMLGIIGRKRVLAPIPFFAAAPLGKVGDLMNWVGGFLPIINAPVTSDQVTSLKVDNIVGISGEDGIGTIADFEIDPETMSSILPTYLVRFREKGQFSPETA